MTETRFLIEVLWPDFDTRQMDDVLSRTGNALEVLHRAGVDASLGAATLIVEDDAVYIEIVANDAEVVERVAELAELGSHRVLRAKRFDP